MAEGDRGGRSLELNLALTSDFPSTANHWVVEFMRSGGPDPRIAWIPPFTATGHTLFPSAQGSFGAFGFSALEYCDIDEEANEAQLARLDKYDVVYLTGGDLLGFRRNIVRYGLSERFHEYLASGRLIVAASGGSMQFTRNVSLFRLLTATVDDVTANLGDYEGLGVVDYEILPHLNRLDARFLEKVQRYSERVPHEVIALADGAAVLHAGEGGRSFAGHVARLRNGV